MNLNLKNNLILLIGYTFILLLVLINSKNAFFWDTVQLGSLHADFYYNHNFSQILLPNNIDSGHIPAFGMYIGMMWKIFERTLLVSHLAMLPFVLGILDQLYQLVQKFVDKKYWGYAFLLILIDPSLLSQMTLVSPDIPLIFFFLIALNAVLKNNRVLLAVAIIFLFLVSMRGMMLSLGILFFDLIINKSFEKNFKNTLINLMKRSVIYIPAFLIFIFFNIYHYREKGWIFYHANSPWAESFEKVNFIGFLYNIGILGWRIVDFGRIGIWTVLLILFLYYRNNFLKESKTRLLIILFFIISIVLTVNMLWAKMLLGHRYLIPIYLIFSLLVVHILYSSYIKESLKIYLSILWVIVLVSGNFWIYPPKISQGWDSTLAHIPYYNLRTEAINYLENEKIDIKQVASFFPNLGTLDNLDLNHKTDKFSNFDQTKEYVFYSNIYNIGDNEYETIINNYEVIKQFKKMNIFIWICKKKKL